MMTFFVISAFALMVGAWVRQWTAGRRAGQAWRQGMAALEQQDLATAEKAFQHCVKTAPSSAVARRMLGSVLRMKGDYAAAEEHLRFGADLEPRNPEGYLDLALFYMTHPEPDESKALAALEAAAPHAPRLLEQLAQFPPLTPLRARLEARLAVAGKE